METLMYSLAKFGKIKFTGIPFSFKFDALDGNENSDILQNWRRIKLSLSAVLSYLTFIPLFGTHPVWPDLAKFRHFYKKSKVLGNF